MTLIAAADGSALGNPGPAGWAWYINDDQWKCGGWERATNNQGELMAVLSLLQETGVERERPLKIFCDSQYVINAMTVWIHNWKRNNWRKSDGKKVLNSELIKLIDHELAGRDVTFEWVKGHSGHHLNELADDLANGAARSFMERKSLDSGPGFNESSSTQEFILPADQTSTLF